MAAYQVPPSLGFSKQEQWSGLPFPSPMHKSEKWKWSRSVMSDSSRPHGLQSTRLLHPWDSPSKSTGVGCHCLLHIGLYKTPKQCMYQAQDKSKLNISISFYLCFSSNFSFPLWGVLSYSANNYRWQTIVLVMSWTAKEYVGRDMNNAQNFSLNL